MAAIDRAISAGLTALRKIAGHVVTYRRGSSAVRLTAVRDTTTYEQLDAQGMLQRFESADWLLQSSLLVISGSETLPARGDTIEETIDGATVKYEVMGGPNNGPLYEWVDDRRETLKIHTKQIFG